MSRRCTDGIPRPFGGIVFGYNNVTSISFYKNILERKIIERIPVFTFSYYRP